jgi:hypothetical protein
MLLNRCLRCRLDAQPRTWHTAHDATAVRTKRHPEFAKAALQLWRLNVDVGCITSDEDDAFDAVMLDRHA